MRLVVTTEGHFHQTPDGRVWSTGPMTQAFWQRYLSVFDRVEVVARVRGVDQPREHFRRADGPGIGFRPLPEYVGPVQYVLRLADIRRAARDAALQDAALLLRVGCSQLAAEVERYARRRHKPFGLEVITDPFEVFAPGAVKHPLRAYFRRKFTQDLRRQCSTACAVAYVTESSLQRRYLPGAHTFSISCSDVILDAQAFANQPRSFGKPLRAARLVSIGSMAQMYKGFDVLIDAVHQCVDVGLDLTLVLVGDGRHRPELEEQVRHLGLESRVTFTGQLSSGAAVREQIDTSDIFVLASRTEGLPRVVLEAMARGIPCIGTDVGGIPEVLDPVDLVPAESAEALAARIRDFCAHPDVMTARASRHLRRSRDYEAAVLSNRRDAFLGRLREETSAWMAGLGRPAEAWNDSIRENEPWWTATTPDVSPGDPS